MARVVASDDDESRRALVEPVDDPGARRSADGRPGAASAQERMDQGAGVMPWRRVNDHTRRLVDDGKVLVLVKDLERDRLCGGVRDVSLRDLEIHDVARRHAIRRIGGSAVDADEMALDQTRGGRAAEVFSVLREKAIQPRSRGRRDQAAGLQGSPRTHGEASESRGPRELKAKPRSSWGSLVGSSS